MGLPKGPASELASAHGPTREEWRRPWGRRCSACRLATDSLRLPVRSCAAPTSEFH